MLEVISLPELNLHRKFRLNYTLIRMLFMLQLQIWRNPKQILLPVPEIWLADPGICPTWQSKSPVLYTRTLSCWNRQASSRMSLYWVTLRFKIIGLGVPTYFWPWSLSACWKKNNLDQLKLELVLDVQSYCWPARPVDELKPAWKCSNWHQQWSGHLFWSWL